MFTMSRKLASIAILTGLAALSIQSSYARDTDFAKDHPRRAEVIQREKHQKATNAKDAKNGSLTQAQAHQLNKEDNSIRREERADAAAGGGRITKSEQKQLNQQENAVNAQRSADIQSIKAGLATGK